MACAWSLTFTQQLQWYLSQLRFEAIEEDGVP